MLAARRPFLRVEGVELSGAMHHAALRNIARAKELGRVRSPIVAHQKDVAEYEPPKEPFILYLFNPFGEAVISHLLDRLDVSLHNCPREAYFIYLNAKHRNCFDRRPFLQEMPRPIWARRMDRLVSPWPLVTYRARL